MRQRHSMISLARLTFLVLMFVTFAAGPLTTSAAPMSHAKPQLLGLAQDEDDDEEADPQELLDAAAMQGWIDAATEQESAFGPAEGTLTQEIGNVAIGFSEVDLPDFYASVVFTNPTDADVWDFGFGFRFAESGEHYQLRIQSNGSYHFTSIGTESSSIGIGGLNGFDPEPGATNRVQLVASGESGYFAVNNIFGGTLSLTAPVTGGEVWIGSGFSRDWLTDGAVIAFSDFEVWSLEGLTPPVVETTPVAETADAGEVVRDWYEALYTDSGADLSEFLAEDFVKHEPAPADPLDRDAYVADVTASVDALHTAFPDLSYSIEDLLVDEGDVAVRVRFTGTQTGDLGTLAATGKPIEIEEFAIYRVEDGKIAEAWVLADELGLLEQLGVPIGEASQEAVTPTEESQPVIPQEGTPEPGTPAAESADCVGVEPWVTTAAERIDEVLNAANRITGMESTDPELPDTLSDISEEMADFAAAQEDEDVPDSAEEINDRLVAVFSTYADGYALLAEGVEEEDQTKIDEGLEILTEGDTELASVSADGRDLAESCGIELPQ